MRMYKQCANVRVLIDNTKLSVRRLTLEGVITFLFLYYVILPGTFVFLLWKGVFKTQREWFGSVIFSTLYMSWIFFSGRWDWFSYYIRYIWVVLFLIAIYQSFKKMKPLPFKKPPSLKGKLITTFLIIVTLMFLLRNFGIVASISVGDDSIDLSFPLKDGTYYIGHGGSSTEMNYHHAYEPQQYALDILQLNQFGMRTKGLYPKELEKYVIYGASLYSPCDGKVLEVENDMPDLTPGDSDPNNPLGNYAALKCDGNEATIYIAHMQQGSVQKKEGDILQDGEVIGSVGNSGNTSEPHLHIHAEKDGVGIPMRFDEKYPVRNSLIKN